MWQIKRELIDRKEYLISRLNKCKQMSDDLFKSELTIKCTNEDVETTLELTAFEKMDFLNMFLTKFEVEIQEEIKYINNKLHETYL